MQKRTDSVQIESSGSILQGHFFHAGGTATLPTAIIVPGWPGNPDDVLGLGEFLSNHGVDVLVFNPRGFHGSEGVSTFANTLEDISAVIDWVQSDAGSHSIAGDHPILGGYSYGGGMALAYAAQDPAIRAVFSVSGADHAQLIRRYQQEPEFAAMLEEALASTVAPEGPVKCNIKFGLSELAQNQDVYGLRENAALLADRSILIIGGWEDQDVSVDDALLPFYRALRTKGAEDVTFVVYHDDHEFARVRSQLSAALLDWILKRVASAQQPAGASWDSSSVGSRGSNRGNCQQAA